ncbi:MFS nicotinic acid transporter [Rhodotorula toruloides]|uniref:MFS nicotinic acid transporter n=1 Tax=Rhodotorula toruloides TaxID=5286 RepID=A0A511KN44_RHOTO|nr:MFS nicotinic acid transporter [Rhodotorula toruloides]
MSDVEKHFPQEEKIGAAEHLERVSSSGDGDGHVKLPSRMFTPLEEKKLYRKVVLRIMPILSLLYLLSFMDGGNIGIVVTRNLRRPLTPSRQSPPGPSSAGNARLEGLEKDLKLTSQQYNTALSCFFVTYCLCEVPASLIMKRFRRPSRWLGLITTLWAVVMTLMGVVQNYGGLLAARLCLGIAEAGHSSGALLRRRYAGRGFLRGVAGYSGWRWIFILEGLATFVVGCAGFFVICDFPQDCKWLTTEEKEWLVYRKATDSSSVGEAEHVSKAYIWQAVKDWQTWVAICFYLGVVVPLYAISLVSPTLIASFGQYTRAQSQLLTLPVYVCACAFVVGTSILADRQRTRFRYMMLDLILCLIGLVISISPAPTGAKYFALIVIACGAYGGLPTSVTWLTNNLSGQTTRAIGSAMQLELGNLGALASTNVYRTKDKPRYLLGHGVVLGFTCLGLVAAPLYAYLLSRENARKRAILALPDGHPDKKVFSAEEIREAGDRSIRL